MRVEPNFFLPICLSLSLLFRNNFKLRNVTRIKIVHSTKNAHVHLFFFFSGCAVFFSGCGILVP